MIFVRVNSEKNNEKNASGPNIQVVSTKLLIIIPNGESLL